jgi:hypothetical protein
LWPYNGFRNRGETGLLVMLKQEWKSTLAPSRWAFGKLMRMGEVALGLKMLRCYGKLREACGTTAHMEPMGPRKMSLEKVVHYWDFVLWRAVPVFCGA